MKLEADQHVVNTLTIKIYGMDDEGKPFFQPAKARPLTVRTALLEGMKHRLKSGNILGVQYKGRKARAQVVWMCEVNRHGQNQMEIRLLVAEPCPWAEPLQAIIRRASDPASEKRKHPRYQIRVALDLQQPDTDVRMQVQCTDISLGGCYVHTTLPLPVGTLLMTGIWMGREKIEVSALVRTCDRNVGMGIEFINLAHEQEIRLQQFFVSSLSSSLVHG